MDDRFRYYMLVCDELHEAQGRTFAYAYRTESGAARAAEKWLLALSDECLLRQWHKKERRILPGSRCVSQKPISVVLSWYEEERDRTERVHTHTVVVAGKEYSRAETDVIYGPWQMVLTASGTKPQLHLISVRIEGRTLVWAPEERDV